MSGLVAQVARGATATNTNAAAASPAGAVACKVSWHRAHVAAWPSSRLGHHHPAATAALLLLVMVVVVMVVHAAATPRAVPRHVAPHAAGVANADHGLRSAASPTGAVARKVSTAAACVTRVIAADVSAATTVGRGHHHVGAAATTPSTLLKHHGRAGGALTRKVPWATAVVAVVRRGTGTVARKVPDAAAVVARVRASRGAGALPGEVATVAAEVADAALGLAAGALPSKVPSLVADVARFRGAVDVLRAETGVVAALTAHTAGLATRSRAVARKVTDGTAIAAARARWLLVGMGAGVAAVARKVPLLTAGEAGLLAPLRAVPHKVSRLAADVALDGLRGAVAGVVPHVVAMGARLLRVNERHVLRAAALDDLAEDGGHVGAVIDAAVQTALVLQPEEGQLRLDARGHARRLARRLLEDRLHVHKRRQALGAVGAHLVRLVRQLRRQHRHEIPRAVGDNRKRVLRRGVLVVPIRRRRGHEVGVEPEVREPLAVVRQDLAEGPRALNGVLRDAREIGAECGQGRLLHGAHVLLERRDDVAGRGLDEHGGELDDLLGGLLRLVRLARCLEIQNDKVLELHIFLFFFSVDGCPFSLDF
eukprot:PhM_4_TR18736/c0_g1_i1/m.65811